MSILVAFMAFSILVVICYPVLLSSENSSNDQDDSSFRSEVCLIEIFKT